MQNFNLFDSHQRYEILSQNLMYRKIRITISFVYFLFISRKTKFKIMCKHISQDNNLIA